MLASVSARAMQGGGGCRPFSGEHEILSLEIAVHDVKAVHVVDGNGDLRKDGERVVLFERALGQKLLKEFATTQTLLHNVDFVRIAHDLDEVHNVSGRHRWHRWQESRREK